MGLVLIHEESLQCGGIFSKIFFSEIWSVLIRGDFSQKFFFQKRGVSIILGDFSQKFFLGFSPIYFVKGIMAGFSHVKMSYIGRDTEEGRG